MKTQANQNPLLTSLLRQEAAILKDLNGIDPPAKGYDLRDPILRKELLSPTPELVGFPLHPLPEGVQSFLGTRKQPLTLSEQEMVCEFMDMHYGLTPLFCTTIDPVTHEVQVLDDEPESLRKTQAERAARKAGVRPQEPEAYTTLDLLAIRQAIATLRSVGE